MDEEKKTLAVYDDKLVNTLFSKCGAEYKANLTFTDTEFAKLKEFMLSVKVGDFGCVPMLCLGDRCVNSKACALLEMNKAPIGRMCPLEYFALNTWREDYVESMEVNKNDRVEMSQVNTIVECDIINARANMILGSEGLIMDNPIGIDQATGTAITRQEVHAALAIKDMALNRKDKIFKNFLSNRSDKVKALGIIKKDPTEYFAELTSRARKLAEKHENLVEAQIEESKGEGNGQRNNEGSGGNNPAAEPSQGTDFN